MSLLRARHKQFSVCHAVWDVSATLIEIGNFLRIPVLRYEEVYSFGEAALRREKIELINTLLIPVS